MGDSEPGVKTDGDWAERVKKLQREIDDEQKANRRMKLEMKRALEERDACQKRQDLKDANQAHDSSPLRQTTPDVFATSRPSTPESRKHIRRLKLQLTTLQSQYDDLLAYHKRVEARYKRHFEQWRSVKAWLFDEETDKEQWTRKGLDLHKDEMSEEERRRRTNARVWKKREILIKRHREQVVSGNKPSAGGENKENVCPSASNCQNEKKIVGSESIGREPLHDRKRRRLNEDLAATDTTPLNTEFQQSPVVLVPSSAELLLPTFSSVATPGPPVSSEGVLITAVTPLTDSSPTVFGSALPPNVLFDNGPIPTPCPLKYAAIPPLSAQEGDNDRQVGSDGYIPSSYKRKYFSDIEVQLPDQIPGSSDTEEDSQAPDPVPDEHLEIISVSHSLKALAVHTDERLISLQSSPAHKSPSPDAAERINLSKASDSTELCIRRGKQSNQTPRVQGTGSNGQATITPTNKTSSSSKQLTDYSAYKGRGRYAQQLTSADKTINSNYAIDSSRNEGVDFQFEEVVRGRENRRRLHAEDCECCREYYEASGPLPNRLQPPLWRSPSPTPDKKCRSRHRHSSPTSHISIGGEEDGNEDDRGRREAITAHKQVISRHRNRWTRALTPPGYWNIGFPTTQEAKEINERASEMHKAKRRSIEAEAARGDGKYTRRQQF